jgi:hypothetical protein
MTTVGASFQQDVLLTCHNMCLMVHLPILPLLLLLLSGLQMSLWRSLSLA